MKIIKNKYGYYEISNKPSKEELENYYKNKYYQLNNSKTYNISYTKDELLNFKNNFLKEQYIINNILNCNFTHKKYLDIGCGEGYSLKYYKKHKFNCLGLDYSDYGLLNHNPTLIDDLITGDIYENIDNLILKNKIFDIISLYNVLEHVLEPQEILNKIGNLMNEKSILIIKVPNDFSYLQKELTKTGKFDNYWIAYPDHLSYFNINNIQKLIDQCGFTIKYYISDYPIDFDLIIDETDYIHNKSLGKISHKKRILIDNMMCNISISKTVEYYNKLCELGLGRNITIYLQKNYNK